ncbi:MAG: Rrf2 family transcriptional regulator [Desulfobulbaceae bacterium]|nr:Rrf2 family transcriptional regulator [Desulfobulbaceae bacterium]HIJ91085.1 Rrf2 family transcriptional regulator [Deltaproteobacteria bacterium]
MRLTRAGEYGIRCVLYLARHGKGTLVSRKEIAVRTDVPPHFLAKIAQQLARAGIIEILQGANGGYRLLTDPERITMLEVIEAIIGEISLNDCVSRPESCRISARCTVHRVWNKANQQLRATLEETNFATLASEDACCLTPFPLAGDHDPSMGKK